MSQLQSIATRLRALAQDVSPLSTNVEASARQLNSLIHQVETLSRSGVNTGPLLAAMKQAQGQARVAAHTAAQVKSEGVAWAEHLALGGTGSTGNLGANSLAPPNLPGGGGATPLDDTREVIPAGSAFLGDGDSDFMHNWPHGLPPANFEHAVVIHGNPDIVGVKYKDGSVQVASPKQLNDSLPDDGKVVRLYSCDTGQTSDGFAQQLADIRGTTVIAPTHKVYARPGGDYVIGEYDPVTNQFTQGSWRTFFPKGGAI